MRISTNIVAPMLRPRIAVPVVATAVVGGAVATYVALRRSSSEQATSGAQQLGATPVATPTPSPADATGPTLRLERMTSGPATNAADPASFERLFASDGPGWAAADGTISVPLPDGRSMWLFGDTVLRPGTGPATTMIRNSAVIQDGAKLTTLANGTEQAPDAFLRPTDGSNDWYWPAGGVAQGDEIALFMGRVRETATGSPGWNFTGAGSDLVLVDAKTMAPKATTRLPGGDGMVWGAATVQSGDHTYVYGFEQGAAPLDRYAHVARVANGQVGHAPLEYWDGTSWTSDASKSARIADGLSNQFNVVPLPDGRFAMLSQQLMLSRGLEARVADSPTGPWSAPKVVDEGPELAPGVISYNAMAHPQFTAEGQLLVGWNKNRPDVLVGADPELQRDYRAAFRAVPLDSLD